MGKSCDSDCDGTGVSDMRPDIIDGFERKSVALLDYVNNLEAQLEQLKVNFEHKEGRLKADRKALEDEFSQRDCKLKGEKRCLEEKLHHSQDQVSRSQKALMCEERKRHASEEVARNLKLDVRAAQDVLHNERQRTKELEQQLCEIKEQLRNREHAYNRRRIKDEREKARLDEEVTILRKKVTLGWILGCLTEVYLRVDDNEGDKCGKIKVDCRPAKLENIEREVRRLVNCQDSPQKCYSSPKRGDPCASECEPECDIEANVDPCRPCRFGQRGMEADHECDNGSASPTPSSMV